MIDEPITIMMTNEESGRGGMALTAPPIKPPKSPLRSSALVSSSSGAIAPTSISDTESLDDDNRHASSSNRKRTTSDASTGMRATSTWFTSTLNDDDESMPSSPTGSEWPQESGSLFERAKEALNLNEEQPVATSSAAAYTSPAASAAVAPPISSKRATTLPTSGTKDGGLLRIPSLGSSTKMQRSPSKSSSFASGSGGILGRLRRISKKERRAATLDSPGLVTEEPFVMVSAERADGLGESASEEDIANESSRTMTTSTSQRSIRPVDMPIRDFSQERMPTFGDHRVQSVHSVQPSLVDDQSIMERQSPSVSLLEIDEDEAWEDPDPMPITPIEPGALLDSGSVKKVRDIDDEEHEDSDWHLQNIPGSFFTRTPTKTEVLDVYQTTPKIQEPDSAFSTIDSTPTQTDKAEFEDQRSLRPKPHARPSEYMQALSRQPSESQLAETKREGDDTLTADGVQEEALTPRADADVGKASYFDSQTVAPSASPLAGFESYASSKPLNQDQLWLSKARLAAEERHYLIRFMATKQIVWEAQRLFLLNNAQDLDRPSSTNTKSDMAQLKMSQGEVVPEMPITRLVLRHVLMTCPIFSAAVPIEGAAAQRTRTAGATKFFNEGVLPLARFIHRNSVSRPVELNGEWPTEIFDAPSTLDVMQSSCVKLLARYVSALVDGRGHGFLWTKVPGPTAYDYIGHRTTLNKLKQGGMEVNVVGCRLRASSRECEFIISVRRYGFPPAYVIRTESDFYNFARSLAEELGPQVRVRAVPPPDVDMTSLLAAASVAANEDPETASTSSADTGSKSPSLPPSSANMARSVSSRSREPFTDTIDSANNSLFNASLRNTSSASLASSVKQARRRSVESLLAPRQALSPRIFSPRAGVGARNGSMSDVSTRLPSNGRSTPITTDEEARRKQMRAWLRDALSIRGAGHAQQTRAFLHNDGFTDREMKPASRKDVLSRLEVDEAAKQERERSFGEAAREVFDLRAEMTDVWRQCVEADGVERALKAIKANDTFSSLPLTYQRIISWTNLQTANFLHHVFVDSHEAKANFERFQQFVNAVPWKLLSTALRERTGMMMQMVQKCLLDGAVREKLTAIFLQDAPSNKVEEELDVLRKRLGRTVLKKLQAFANSTEFQKAVVRQAARQAGIPLVAAIMRGSDKPLLAVEGMKKVVSATRVYQDFVAGQPTYAELRAKLKANVDVRLIYDMQRALRLICQQRDGKTIRQGVEKELKAAIEALIEPLLGLLKRFHRGKQLVRQHSTSASSKSSSSRSDGASSDQAQDVVTDLQQFCLKLLDVLAGIRARVQDPWRSLSTLTLLLDDAVPAWYQLLHTSATADSFVQDVAMWVQNMAALLRFRHGGGGDDLLSLFWPKEKQDMPFERRQGEERTALESMVDANWRKRSRQLETACRWVAGESDADMDVQLIGEGGKTRTTRYEMPKIKLGPEAKVESALLPLLPGFRSALGRVLGADPGTAW